MATKSMTKPKAKSKKGAPTKKGLTKRVHPSTKKKTETLGAGTGKVDPATGNMSLVSTPGSVAQERVLQTSLKGNAIDFGLYAEWQSAVKS
jgi:hypothetical protein